MAQHEYALPASSRSPVVYKKSYCKSMFAPSEFQNIFALLKQQPYLQHFSSLFLSKLIHKLRKHDDEERVTEEEGDGELIILHDGTCVEEDLFSIRRYLFHRTNSDYVSPVATSRNKRNGKVKGRSYFIRCSDYCALVIESEKQKLLLPNKFDLKPVIWEKWMASSHFKVLKQHETCEDFFSTMIIRSGCLKLVNLSRENGLTRLAGPGESIVKHETGVLEISALVDTVVLIIVLLHEDDGGGGENILNSLEVLSSLGNGKFGKVSVALDTKTGKKVALKQTLQRSNKTMQAALAEEAFVLMMLTKETPFVNPFLEVLYSCGNDFIVVEYLEGDNLLGLLEKFGSKWTKKMRTYLIACILSGVASLHDLDVLYRDLKLENIVISKRDGTVKIIDFGLAKLLLPVGRLVAAVTKTYTLCGTLEYMSPEILLGEGYGFPNDCWALGILSYEIFNGFSPFSLYSEGVKPTVASEEESVLSLLSLKNRALVVSEKINLFLIKNILKEPIPLSEDWVDQDEIDFVLRLLVRNPQERCTLRNAHLHEFFHDFDFDELLTRRINSPFQFFSTV